MACQLAAASPSSLHVLRRSLAQATSLHLQQKSPSEGPGLLGARDHHVPFRRSLNQRLQPERSGLIRGARSIVGKGIASPIPNREFGITQHSVHPVACRGINPPAMLANTGEVLVLDPVASRPDVQEVCAPMEP